MFTNVINILFTNVKLLFIFVNYKFKQIASILTETKTESILVVYVCNSL